MESRLSQHDQSIFNNNIDQSTMIYKLPAQRQPIIDPNYYEAK